ncbi:fumarylacetoacetate hydrolase family protein [Verrucomicrobiales bacterium]|nr:fumarylacetoacetate hydrolase family protein [Verrucomicrobiales bacterium]MDC3353228.1 fumarylacetoacetate hydrolase family protein [Verrucomicrobiales bacterium]
MTKRDLVDTVVAMKLLRFGDVGLEKPGLQLDNGTRIDASGFGMDWNHDFFADPGNLDRLQEWVGANAESAPVISDDTRLGSAVARPGKLICIGLNFSDHAAEAGMPVPDEPIVFFKATSAIVGPYDNVVIPRNSQKTDWEVELAFVVGKKASYVTEDEALDYVAGYVLHNDYSEREFQIERGGQWVKGKSCDTFAPLGPFVATSDEIKDPENLGMWLKVNGETKQDGNSNKLIFGIAHLVSYLSQFMTLEPGDVVSTGTPPGVGMGFDPPQYMKPGDVVELGIDGLGSSSQTAVACD